jgi:hypothetical protein
MGKSSEGSRKKPRDLINFAIPLSVESNQDEGMHHEPITSLEVE